VNHQQRDPTRQERRQRLVERELVGHHPAELELTVDHQEAVTLQASLLARPEVGHTHASSD
jgi:hypothetical protein